MPFQFEDTKIDGVKRIHYHTFPDARGVYAKHYEENVYAEHGITCKFTEASDLYTQKGALRGIHFQTVEPQAKLIRVVSGSLFDVAVDLRKDSPTYGQYHAELLRGEDPIAIFIPEEFAHGFMALEEGTVFSYMCSGRYVPEACGGIVWDDDTLAIPWPLEQLGGKDKMIISEKDKALMSFAEFTASKNTFGGGL